MNKNKKNISRVDVDMNRKEMRILSPAEVRKGNKESLKRKDERNKKEGGQENEIFGIVMLIFCFIFICVYFGRGIKEGYNFSNILIFQMKR